MNTTELVFNIIGLVLQLVTLVFLAIWWKEEKRKGKRRDLVRVTAIILSVFILYSLVRLILTFAGVIEY